MEDSLSPQGRAGKAVFLLLAHGSMTSNELMEKLGYSKRDGLVYLLDNLSESVPLQHDELTDSWQIIEQKGQT